MSTSAQDLFDEKPEAAETPEEQLKIPEVLPVLPLRDIVIFPFMIVPLFVSRDRSMQAVDQALAENRMIMLVAQRDLEKEEPKPGDVFDFGTVGIIMRMLKLPDGRIRILVQGVSRARINFIEDTSNFLQARIEPLQEITPEASLEVEALIRNVRGSMEKAVGLGKNVSPVMAIIANHSGRLADLASNLEQSWMGNLSGELDVTSVCGESTSCLPRKSRC
jgi:ATP-dependent Lon protease